MVTRRSASAAARSALEFTAWAKDAVSCERVGGAEPGGETVKEEDDDEEEEV